MKESNAITLLIILGAVVNLCAAFCCAALMAWTSAGGAVRFAVVIAVFLLNITVLARARKWFYREYALSAPKFVLFGAVPSVLLSFAGIAVVDVIESLGAFGSAPDNSAGLPGAEVLYMWFFCIVILLYTVSVLIGLSVTLGISRALDLH